MHIEVTTIWESGAWASSLGGSSFTAKSVKATCKMSETVCEIIAARNTLPRVAKREKERRRWGRSVVWRLHNIKNIESFRCPFHSHGSAPVIGQSLDGTPARDCASLPQQHSAIKGSLSSIKCNTAGLKQALRISPMQCHLAGPRVALHASSN